MQKRVNLFLIIVLVLLVFGMNVNAYTLTIPSGSWDRNEYRFTLPSVTSTTISSWSFTVTYDKDLPSNVHSSCVVDIFVTTSDGSMHSLDSSTFTSNVTGQTIKKTSVINAGVVSIFMAPKYTSTCLDISNHFTFSNLVLDLGLGMIGAGTSSNPYQVTNCTQLNEMKNSLTSWYSIQNNFSCSGINFSPGTASTPFSGNLNGHDFNITDLTINTPTLSHIGLFKYSTGNISNIRLINVDIDASSYVGAITGTQTSGTINNCFVSGNVNGRASHIGGLVGESIAAGTISNSSSTVNVTSNSVYTGGLVGFSYGTISNSNATGVIIGNSQTGGLVGQSNGAISGSSATGTVTGDTYVGGLVGYAHGPVSQSYATGNISGLSQVGGLVGRSISSISQSHSTGTVYGTSTNIGGLVGYAEGAISQSYAMGAVSSGSQNVGGLVGYSSDMISDSYARGSVSGTNYLGGLVGKSSNVGIIHSYSIGHITNSSPNYNGGLIGYLSISSCPNCAFLFYDYETAGTTTSDGGISKTTTEMKTQTTFTSAGWDFTSTWKLCSGEYPTFQRSGTCSVPRVDGACSSTRAKSFLATETAWPSGSVYCLSGVASSSPGFPSAGSSVSWVCNSTTGGNPSGNCVAIRSASSVVNGVCNSSVLNNCVTGVAVDIGTTDDNATHSKWICNGSGVGATNAPCSLLKSIPNVQGVCNSVYNNKYLVSAPSVNLCDNGDSSSVSGVGPWTWTCGSGTGLINCTAYRFVNGVCNPSYDGQNLVSAPSGNLCSSGDASSVSGSGPWTWTCSGSGPGALVDSCVANKYVSATDGACSSTRNTTFASSITAWPSGSVYCLSGVASSSPGFPSAGSSVSWVCNSTSGGNPSGNCVAIRSASSVVNGVCGDANGGSFPSIPVSNLCSVGSVSVVSGSGPWTWTCSGSGTGAISASCSASKSSSVINGVCNSSVNNGCVSGSLNNVDDNLTHYKWECNGSGVGATNAPCNLLKSIPNVYGVCNSSILNRCVVGVAVDTGTTDDNLTHYRWSCNGSGAGLVNASCSLPKIITNFYCLGEIDSNSIMYPDENVGLDNNYFKKLVTLNTSEKCEYHCKTNFMKSSTEEKCIPNPYVCSGVVDGNSILYVDDNYDLTINTQNVLVESNTSAKCEYYCKRGFYKGSGVDENKCLPGTYYCTGNDFNNAKRYVDENVGLDSNYLNILVDFNTPTKCEWYCDTNYKKGVGNNSNICVSASLRTCDGNIDPNAQLFVGDDENISLVDNRTNILVVENSELKCEWHCKSGYYLEDSSSGYVCVPEVVEEFNCSGAIDGNAVIFSNDNRGLVVDLNNVLVDFNTGRKCEWYCKGGFYLGSVSGVGVCLPNRYSCKNSVSGGVIYLGDDSGLTSDLNSVLVEANSSRKCEYHCGRYYVKVGDACVLSVVSNAVCGNAEKSYTVEESFFGSYSLCSVGVSSLSNPVLGSEVGSIVEWVCVSDVNVSCSASRVSSKYVPPVENNDVLNSIEVLTSQMLDDGNLEVTMKCLKTTVVDLDIADYVSKKVYSSSQKQFDCTTSESTYKIKLDSAPEVERSLVISASMGSNETACSTCKLDYFIEYVPSASLTESDPNGPIFLGILILVILVAIAIVGLTMMQNKK